MYLRYHHLSQLVNLSAQFKEWKKVPLKNSPTVDISDLYRFSTIASQFISQKAYMEGKGIVLDILEDRKQISTFSYWQDYVGTNGDFLQEYVKGLEGIYSELLLSDPSTQVQMGYETDHICSNCQRKAPKTDVGFHCVESYGNHIDYIWESTVESLTHPKIKKDNDSPSHISEVGILRNLAASGILEKQYHEIYRTIEGNMPQLTDEGILFDDIDTGYIKVNPRYLGKERY